MNRVYVLVLADTSTTFENIAGKDDCCFTQGAMNIQGDHNETSHNIVTTCHNSFERL
jgi:hypothetical protein